jgi:hypothetical protein
MKSLFEISVSADGCRSVQMELTPEEELLVRRLAEAFEMEPRAAYDPRIMIERLEDQPRLPGCADCADRCSEDCGCACHCDGDGNRIQDQP